MMERYLLDTHSISNKIIGLSRQRDDLFIVEEVLDEWALSDSDRKKIKASKIGILKLEARHYSKMREILDLIGTDFKLIDLKNNKGTGDIAMLAYILGEKENEKRELFQNSYTLVTQDAELGSTAESFGIKVIEGIF